MARTIAVHQLYDLTHWDSKNEILLNTKQNTQLHIVEKSGQTIISLPFGNKFDIVDGMIIINEK